MNKEIAEDAVFIPSEDVVAREIEGELIIVPLVSGIGDIDDELFTFNETGKAIWDKLDGKKRLIDVVAELQNEFEDQKEEILPDVMGLIAELLKRKIIVQVRNR